MGRSVIRKFDTPALPPPSIRLPPVILGAWGELSALRVALTRTPRKERLGAGRDIQGLDTVAGKVDQAGDNVAANDVQLQGLKLLREVMKYGIESMMLVDPGAKISWNLPPPIPCSKAAGPSAALQSPPWLRAFARTNEGYRPSCHLRLAGRHRWSKNPPGPWCACPPAPGSSHRG